MILQVHTEKELIDMVESLKKEVDQLRTQNKELIKRFDELQPSINQNPSVQIKEASSNLKAGATSNDVIELIKKHVTILYINKLYGK
tara:strand:- start:37 stop:297 length:261 start_codon:yes stop_codon:yes gene_type:complete